MQGHCRARSRRPAGSSRERVGWWVLSPRDCVEGHLRNSASGGRKFFLLRSSCGLAGVALCDCVEGHLRHSASGGRKFFLLRSSCRLAGVAPREGVEGTSDIPLQGGRKLFLLRSSCGLAGAAPRECVEGHLRNAASWGQKVFPLEAIRKPAPRGAGIDRPTCQSQVEHGSPRAPETPNTDHIRRSNFVQAPALLNYQCLVKTERGRMRNYSAQKLVKTKVFNITRHDACIALS